MSEKQQDGPGNSGRIIQFDEGEVASLLSRKVLESVEETLNGLLDAEADALCGAARHGRSAERVNTRAGHYERIVSLNPVPARRWPTIRRRSRRRAPRAANNARCPRPSGT